jgi:hypothetical protein
MIYIYIYNMIYIYIYLLRPAGESVAPSQAVIGFSTVDDMALLNIEGPALVGVKGSAVRPPPARCLPCSTYVVVIYVYVCIMFIIF